MKILKVATTRWLTHGQASKRVLDRFKEILITLGSIWEDTFRPELWCYRADMMEHVNIFTLCLTTDILRIVNFFWLVLQKQGRKFTDINVIMECTVKTLESLSSTMSSEQLYKMLYHFQTPKTIVAIMYHVKNMLISSKTIASRIKIYIPVGLILTSNRIMKR